MKMTTTQLSKQDYLKKYLSGGDEKKKKKRKKVTTNSIIKSKIIDDDIDLKNMKAIDSDELEVFDLAEEAPQIVGIVDDRPEEVRLMSEYKNTKKWRIVADEHGIDDVKVTAITEDKANESGKQMEKEKPKKDAEKVKSKKSDGKDEEPDPSPPRKIKKEKSDSDASPPRKSNKDRDSDNTPPRNSRKTQDSPVRKIKREKSDSDASPPRRSRKQQQHSPPVRKIKREKSDSDASPPRKSNNKYDLDPSPPRRSKKNYDSDQSTKRRARRSNKRKSEDSDSSPPRSSKRRTRERDSTRRDGKRRKSPDVRGSRRESGKSVSRASENGSKKTRDESPQESKSKNTLGGKKSGLQNADELRKEIEELKEREKEMKANASGKNEAVVVRDRKTGLRIDPKEEARKRREKEEKEAEKMSQYAVWGKGVKQVQDGQDKLRDDLYEMSKPLARYADDKDLDNMLKNKEWDGDPMLEYIRKKRKKNKTGEDGAQKPQYEGAYLPNRYGIRPGHRWDGVDRSNGYEKKWFEEQNAKKAREEEAFKWSTADM